MDFIVHYEPILGVHIWVPNIQMIMKKYNASKVNPRMTIGNPRATCSMHPDDR